MEQPRIVAGIIIPIRRIPVGIKGHIAGPDIAVEVSGLLSLHVPVIGPGLFAIDIGRLGLRGPGKGHHRIAARHRQHEQQGHEQ